MSASILVSLVEAGDAAAVQAELHSADDANQCDSDGCPLLILAVNHGWETVTECLLANCANPNVVCPVLRKTALACACKDGNFNLILMLCDYGATVSEADVELARQATVSDVREIVYYLEGHLEEEE